MAELAKLEARHEIERQALNDLHDSENEGILNARASSQPAGLRAFVMRITGFRMLIDAKHRREDSARARVQQKQKEALRDRHGCELLDVSRRLRDLKAIDTRELRSLETDTKREGFQKLLHQEPVGEAPRAFKQEEVAAQKGDVIQLKPTFDSAAAPGREQRDTDTSAPQRLAALYNRLTRQLRPDISKDFKEAAALPEKKPAGSESADPKDALTRKNMVEREQRRWQQWRDRGPDRDRDR
jgi:hypothetical protein